MSTRPVRKIPALRVMVTGDWALLCLGTAAALKHAPDLADVTVARDTEAVGCARARQPDAVLLVHAGAPDAADLPCSRSCAHCPVRRA